MITSVATTADVVTQVIPRFYQGSQGPACVPLNEGKSLKEKIETFPHIWQKQVPPAITSVVPWGADVVTREREDFTTVLPQRPAACPLINAGNF
jgi:hypothetical protein